MGTDRHRNAQPRRAVACARQGGSRGALHDRVRQARIRRSSLAAYFARKHPSARSEEHTSELQSLMRISYAVFCLKKKTNTKHQTDHFNSTQVQPASTCAQAD